MNRFDSLLELHNDSCFSVYEGFLLEYLASEVLRRPVPIATTWGGARRLAGLPPLFPVQLTLIPANETSEDRVAILTELLRSPFISQLHTVEFREFPPDGLRLICESKQLKPIALTLDLANPEVVACDDAIHLITRSSMARHLRSLALVQPFDDDSALSGLFKNDRLPYLASLKLADLSAGTAELLEDTAASDQLSELSVTWARNPGTLMCAVAKGKRAFRSLKRLEIEGASTVDACIIDDEFTRLCGASHLDRLETFAFRGTLCQVSGEGASQLPTANFARSLQCLDLSLNRLDDDAVERIGAGHWPRLARLELRNCGISSSGVKRFCSHVSESALSWLDLSWNAIGDEGASSLVKCRRIGALCQLWLRDTGLGDQGMADLADSSISSRLCRLSVSGNKISGSGLLSLAQGGCTELRELNIDSNKELGGAARHLFAHGLPQLTSLSATACNIEDADLQGIDRICSSLSYLDLSYNSLTVEGAKAIASAKWARGLRILKVSNNPQLENAGVLSIATSQNLANLCVLDIVRCGANRDIIPMLGDDSNIMNLSFLKTDIMELKELVGPGRRLIGNAVHTSSY
jgi:hypothetical protein